MKLVLNIFLNHTIETAIFTFSAVNPVAAKREKLKPKQYYCAGSFRLTSRKLNVS